MIKVATGISKLFRANPLCIAMLLIVNRCCARMRSSLIGLSLKAPGLRLGSGCRIIGGKHILFGRRVSAQQSLWLEAVTSYGSQQFSPKIVIGDDVCFSDGVHISAISSITIGRHTLFGSKIYVSDHNHGIYGGEGQSCPDDPPAHRMLGGGGPVVIGENVWIGDNSVIVGPVNIGNGAIIGANSVVRNSVAANTMVAGVPAKAVKIFDPNTRSWEKV